MITLPTVGRVTARILAAVLLLAACTTASTPTTATTTPSTTAAPAPTSTDAPCSGERCILLRIDPDASWDDGVPVTAADFVHTFESAGEGPAFDPLYADVVSVEAVGEKEVLIVLDRIGAPFQRLFEVVLPAHDPDATSGDLAPDGDGVWSGDGVTVTAVPADGVRGVIQALRRGEADMAWLPGAPDWAVAELRDLGGFSTVVTPGPDWEMITFNLANPLLADAGIRAWVVSSLDRQALADLTVGTVDPEARPLLSAVGRLVFAAGSGRPEPVAVLPDRCRPGTDGVLVCDGTPLVLRWATTAGDPWRVAMLERATADLGEAGIRVVPDLRLPADLFNSGFLGGDGWDVVAFSWEAPADPTSILDLYRCGGELNIGRLCSPDLDGKIEAALRTVDDDERRALIEEIDQEVLGHLVVIPLFRRPVVWAFQGPVADQGPHDGPFEVAAALGGEVRIAVTSMPEDPATLRALDPLTASLRRSLYRGAFRPTGDGGYAPDLIVDFEIVGG